ncbi:SRPBCC family protein [Micromonospora auratinigra]|uniref:Polyketide cyclase / dehydrase and lipid transport n=1 Tax=Micromonospora auratinigra TaxID=261654 RepID=A0A1A8ZML0_9ACTN|nr:SRPBCC family protein [Micromonospora auratinigra]SBT45123.1 Polyketide cyclase / dehydrase and lipid transport [Micromonospora auratinigra]
MAVVYVETLIHAPVERIWAATQDPGSHRRWDARFGRIDPVPGSSPARFRYETTVLPGVRVGGHGWHAGEHARPDGSRTSALRFGSDDPRSLIATGSGYWRYLPGPDGVRFLTGYRYVPRWGRAGRLADRLFGPAFGWATAWSFDRLRLWLERGVPPERARANAAREVALRALAVGGLAALALPAGPAGTALAVLAGTAVALALPPHPHTPAARRCRRRPPDRLAARPPSLLEQL